MAIDPNLPDHNINTLEQEKFKYRNSEVVVKTESIISDGTDTVRVTNGGLDVNIQDQYTPPFDLFFAELVAATTLVLDAVKHAYTIEVATGHGLTAGHYLLIRDATRASFGGILDVTGDTITLDTPLVADFAAAASAVVHIDREMNVDGSGTPRTFTVATSETETIDITRIMLHITDATSMDDSRFGGVAALTRGLVLRRVDGDTRNIFNAKTNGELAHLSFDAVYSDKAPAGFFGLRVRFTFAGQAKHGVTIRLAPGDRLELIVQDDLTELVSFRAIAAGHIVE